MGLVCHEDGVEKDLRSLEEDLVGVERPLRNLGFVSILSNEVGWFDLDENNTGSLTSILAANATLVRSALADRLSTIVQNLSLIATAFVISFTLSWRIAAVVVATLPLLVGASITEGFGGDYNCAYAKATSLAREAIANIRTVAAFGAEDRISLQFASELNHPNKKAVLRGHVSGFFYGLSQFFFILFLCTRPLVCISSNQAQKL
ncbi:putative xenobiotic-transporting ATPase [Rosa chinensis]|uniref:Putative xenobiotic-transporting ATPase n=1 Tax=Rosa chinensis TaxID=74649 RepID=A0A2P6PZA7_ROSCH|nr:putative xenobiotic-transporting ATPase [Rosa chinensis]